MSEGEFIDLGYVKDFTFSETKTTDDIPETTFAGPPFAPFKPVSMEVTLGEVSPEVMALLTGVPVGEAMPEPIFAIEAWHPIKRTFWQWLRRKPRQWQMIYIPRARVTTREESADGGSSDTP